MRGARHFHLNLNVGAFNEVEKIHTCSSETPGFTYTKFIRGNLPNRICVYDPLKIVLYKPSDLPW